MMQTFRKQGRKCGVTADDSICALILVTQIQKYFVNKNSTMKIVLNFICLSILCSCATNHSDLEAEGLKLTQLSKEWSNAAATTDTAKILSYWADDAVVMSPGQLPLKGKDAIRAMVVGSFKIPGFKISWEPISVSVAQSGDLAYMIEANQITVNDSLGKPIVQKNKGVTIWKKQPDGSWKNIVDMWNANQ
jgi:uncharacterized protein (TIGR02246 family)